ncbi:MAG: SDR family NAD(P)-dependent oxidoreductase [Clostridia bacterium]|nr:SDR family NAD(P)-dependent oxidoreductase [Clostridia bacterium]
MLNKLLNFNEVKMSDGDDGLAVKFEKVSKKDVAIIGISGRLPMAENIEDFWENLRNGKDCIRKLPEQRMKDASALLPNSYRPANPSVMGEAAYLDEIDKFDYEFFNLSLSEAKLMDPNQRLFLQTVWDLIEEAGYSGSRIKGSKTGVFLGFSSDISFEYHMCVNHINPELYKDISVPGNIKSVIASRISYLLDLKGPSMLVDTACSSALVALHLACRSIIEGESEMAIAGGIKLDILPSQQDMGDEIGISSSSGRAKTFDDSSDGTGEGEGVIAVMLKPLSKAMADGDHIYAVVKASAVNQDGSSIGLTAPNSAAQEEVILEAWKEAGIDPETISCIEAHGTATKLGDPIEISGIERAFRRYTDKKSFCAIGSVKTNIGHLDSAAGLVGFVKMALALKHKKIPPSIHFKKPNRKINFVDSPLYVNDKLANWETSGVPLRAGISSFGLSGTNCHVVLEEYREKRIKEDSGVENPGYRIFVISAKSRDVLAQLIEKYRLFLEKGTEYSLDDICYTASTGRMHFSHRIAIVVKDINELKQKLKSLCAESIDETVAYYGEHRIVSYNKESRSKVEITEDVRRELTKSANGKVLSFIEGNEDGEAALNEICRKYIEGAEVDWDLMYKGQRRRKVSLPTYPFKRSRCWVESGNGRVLQYAPGVKEIRHPLIDRCVIKTVGQEIYAAKFNIDTHWVIGEHKVAGKCVMPGTAYLEMVKYVYSMKLPNCCVEMDNVLFISPFILEEGENEELHLILSEENGRHSFMIASESQLEGQWNIHVEGKVTTLGTREAPKYDMNEVMKIVAKNKVVVESERELIVDVGPRWTGINIKLYRGADNEYLASFELSEAFTSDLVEYFLHPSLVDCSVNAINDLIGEGAYLPLSYKKLTVYGPTPKVFYSYIRRTDNGKGNPETARLDILLMDTSGKVFVEAKDYIVKRTSEDEFKFRQLKENKNLFYEVAWKISEPQGSQRELNHENILVFKDRGQLSSSLVQRLRDEGCNVIEVEMGTEFKKLSKDRYVIKGEEDDYCKLFADTGGRKLSKILHLAAMSHVSIDSINQLDDEQSRGVDSLFYMTRALIANKLNNNIDIVLLSDYANAVTKDERKLNPLNAAMFGLGKVVTQEYPHLKCRCIDIDENTLADSIIKELKYEKKSYQVALRGGKRYIGEFSKLELGADREDGVEIKASGVYVITGGTGGIGLEIGKYLASKNKVKIALINRSQIPDKDKWDETLEAGESKKVCRAIRAIREMEGYGSEVCCFNADISVMYEISKVLDSLRNSYGTINGVIHCAGVAGDGFIIRKRKEVFDSVLASKIKGTWIIDKLTEGDKLDFFVMFSSITAVFGAQGQGDYTAANSYLDSFAACRSMQGKRTLAINWPAWKETGMAVDYQVNGMEEAFKPIYTDTALSVFQEVLAKNHHNIILGELNNEVFALSTEQFQIDVSDNIRAAIEAHGAAAKTTAISDDQKKYQNVVLKGGSHDEFSETERKVAGIWAQILGLEQVDIYDNFNSMGGDSILATRLLKKLENEFPGLIDITDVFTYSTVYEMAQYIDSKTAKVESQPVLSGTGEAEKDALDDFLSKLANGEISIDETGKIL